MNVFVSAPVFDLVGTAHIAALPSSDFGTLVRRANKVATLDGGVAVNDFGYTAADRDFRINFKPDPEMDQTLRYLTRTYSFVHVSTSEGFYKAIPSYITGADRATLTLSITEQLA
jgi:hypothetical protein